MKRAFLITAAVCVCATLAFGLVSIHRTARPTATLRVGFLYENDESTPEAYNFALSQIALEDRWGDRVEIHARRNVLETQTRDPLEELVKKGCEIIFASTYSQQVIEVAREHPQVQFCQASCPATQSENRPANYHTFNGEIYQGRYVSGIAAGLKLQELIEEGRIRPDQALIGYVGAYPTSQVISGMTAFVLGVRSVTPQALLRVRYTSSWSDYAREKACARALIEEGCTVIAQHTATIGPAVACEEVAGEKAVIHVGYNESVIDVAPTTSLISTRVNWIPYVTGAVEAVMNGRTIEKTVSGNVHGADISAGFERGWVEMLELNEHIAPAGTREALQNAENAFRKGRVNVFQGAYTGVNPANPRDTVDLRQPYRENADSSLPSFHYILEGVVFQDVED